MESKLRYLTPRQYADMKQYPLQVVEWMMQPSRNTANMFDPRDVDRTSPRHPRLVYRARDAAGIEWPRVVRRVRKTKSLSKPQRAGLALHSCAAPGPESCYVLEQGSP